MNCWNCGITLHQTGKISFRASCDGCQADLHCCRNCVYYKPGLPNDCMVPNTDHVSDRTANNFCEEYKLLGKGPEKRVDPNAAAIKLFGEEEPEKRSDDPQNLFRE